MDNLVLSIKLFDRRIIISNSIIKIWRKYMKEIYEYEVAFSFADEDRKYVEQVATFLKEKKVTVFYDNFEEEKLWGKNLVSYLEGIYNYKSKYCIIFISQFYVQKQWTCFESSSAMARMLENNVMKKEYILPVRFDETKVPGILSTLGYVDGRKKTPEQLGDLIIKKIYGNSESKDFILTIHTFMDLLVEHLITEFPDYWNLTHKESEKDIHITYSFQNYEYYLKIILENSGNLLIFGEYTDVFFDTHTHIPSAKIILNIEEDTISSGEIINYDFFDYMYTGRLSPFEIIKEIKKEILKKGGI